MRLKSASYCGAIATSAAAMFFTAVFASTGSSYSWNSLLNGQDADHLSVLGMNFDPHQIPLMFDKEKFHAARGEGKGQNFLYADGHIRNLLAIEGTISGSQ